jgi:DNA-binding transcriptional LysR family regulator
MLIWPDFLLICNDADQVDDLFILVALARTIGPLPDALNIKTLFEYVAIVAGGTRNPLARRRGLTLADLVEEVWATFPLGSLFGLLIANAFRAKKLPEPAVTSLSPYFLDEICATDRF